MAELSQARQSFAIETTLAGVRLASHLADLRQTGYRVRLIYLWLPGADVAVARVRQRVALGGHSIPEETIRRRYGRSLRNLLQTYRPLADVWHIYDNAQAAPALIARGTLDTATHVEDSAKWDRLCAAATKEESNGSEL